jgi:predicted deacylase
LKEAKMKQQRKVRVLAILAGLTLLATILQVAPAAAAPQSWPNGPWETPQQEDSLSAIRDYPQLVATLENIVKASKGASTLAYAPFPAKGSGRLVPYVTIGNGPRKLMVVAQHHGDEAISSNGMISLIRALSSNAKEARFIRDELTVIVMPRVNIDGFDATPTGDPWRYNVDPNVCPSPTPCPAFYSRGRGYDTNRYNPYLASDPLDDPNKGTVGVGDGANPVPEALNIRAVYDAAGGDDAVEVMLDLHGQGTPLDANRDMVFSSTLWPTATPTADALLIRPQFDAAAELSKRVISVALMARDKIAHANTSKYVGGPEPGINRNAYGLLGSASVLFEHRVVGQKAAGYMADISFRTVMAIVEALADGSLYTTSTERAEALVVAPDNASLFWKCVVARPYTLENYNFCREKYGLSPVGTLPAFPFELGKPGPGEVLDAETALQIIYELENPE